MRQCPKCDRWTLDFDDYFGRFRCFDADCGWMPRSSVERAMRLQRSYEEPTPICTKDIKELGLTFTAEYQKENDALVFDFGLDAPTFEFPEGDGRMVWKIDRILGSVAGFAILGAKEFGVAEVKIDFDAQKAYIEEGLRRVPGAIAAGRVTRVLIENVKVTAHSRGTTQAEPCTALTDAFQTALTKFEEAFSS